MPPIHQCKVQALKFPHCICVCWILDQDCFKAISDVTSYAFKTTSSKMRTDKMDIWSNNTCLSLQRHQRWILPPFLILGKQLHLRHLSVKLLILADDNILPSDRDQPTYRTDHLVTRTAEKSVELREKKAPFPSWQCGVSVSEHHHHPAHTCGGKPEPPLTKKNSRMSFLQQLGKKISLLMMVNCTAMIKSILPSPHHLVGYY